MKRIIALICVFLLMFSLCSCAMLSGKSKDVERYRSQAQEKLDADDIEGAIAILEEGVAYTGDEGLKRMLDAARDLLKSQDLFTSASDTSSPEATSAPETAAAPETSAPETAAAPETTAPETTAVPETTAAPTAAPTAPPATEPKNLLDGFSSSELKTLNVFLSNFSEVFMGSYDSSNYSYYDVLNFCHLHFVINNSNYITFGSTEMWMSAANVDTAAKRYLGASVPHSGTYESSYGNYYRYESGNWYSPAASGESYNDFTIANSMTRNADGTYTVNFDVYSLELAIYFEIGMPAGLYNVRSASQCTYPIEYRYSGTAIIRDYTLSTGSASYQLVRYIT